MDERTRPDRRQELSHEAVLDTLGHRRRRFVLHYLKRQQAANGDSGWVPIDELGARVGSWERDVPVGDLNAGEREEVAESLRKRHVPKMAANGFVEYDSRHDRVRPTDATARNEFYVDRRTGPSRWGLFYLSLATLGTVCIVAAALSVPPFASLPPLVWSGLFLVAVGTVACVHVYDTRYRRRSGTSDRPPKLEQS